MARRGKSRKIRRTGCLFWIFILLIIAVIFLYRGKGSFKETINSLVSVIKGEQKQKIIVKEETKSEEEVQEKDEKEEITLIKPETKEEKPEKQIAEEKKIEQKEEIKKEEKAKEEKANEEKETAPASLERRLETQKTPERLDTAKKVESKKTTTRKTKVESKAIHTRTSTIYYVTVDPTMGEMTLAGIKKTVKYIDSPITRTIQLLLKGPGEAERKRGLKTFIPQGTKLISASLKNNHLTLNFNENFENNYLGREAIEIQLKQILLTCFEFDEVKTVSILINGEKKKYITGEGILLKHYYTRSDLNAL